MSKTFHLPNEIKRHLEYQYSQYHEMFGILESGGELKTPQYLLTSSYAVSAIDKVLSCCDDRMREFAQKALIDPEGDAEQVAVSMGISKGRGRSWKSQLTYALAACEGYIPEPFTPKMVDEHPCSGRIYCIWAGMLQRCYNKSANSYKIYGGRGITVCDEWIKSYFAFEDWAVNNGYRDNLTIDRIDNNGNYDPSNCRWATKKQQQNNRRNNVIVEVAGVQMTIAEAADKYGIERGKAYQRIKLGWTGDEMVGIKNR